MRELFDEIVRRCDAGERVGVCVVARTRGSTPQKAGATMLVLESGETLGTLGGGCVEAEVRVRATRLLAGSDPTPKLMRFKLDDDYGWDDGLVCGGTMDIAVRPVASGSEYAALLQGEAVRFDAIDEAGQPTPIEQELEASTSLVIAGAGHVGFALARLAGPLGFAVTVVDDRRDVASAERFPGAKRVVGDIARELRRLPMDAATHVVIVTRGHKHDADALAAVAEREAGYVGLIGSKRKVVTILKRLAGDGVSEAALRRVHAPIGLDVGAITPEEIAISIAAELIAHRRGVATPGTAMRVMGDALDRAINL